VPFSNSPYLDPHPTTPVQHVFTTLKLPPTIIDGAETSSAIFQEENANGLLVEAANEHASPRTVNDFLYEY
jgi:hypothetical protein